MWSALPNAVYPTFRSGGTSCGMYQIGGSIAAGFGFPSGNTVAQVLPGFDQCGGDTVSWLTTQRSRGALELAPGQSVNVRVTVDASQLTAPGKYAALPVKLHATAPRSWGEVKGTVTSAATAGSAAKPLPGATVQLCAARDAASGTCTHPRYTVTTDAHGGYSLWLPGRGESLAVVASGAGYAAQSKEVVIRRGGVFDVDFSLATA
ncbi:carboxypeptidase regulatory-like domain-containing protein [Catenulispora rubra]|uniref:carboxypeptidase regulatory-like domain-containing protein n=1 Tax=Catenulispora rubra TaxID=280293 RepID=UPI0018923599|nr:carboxypeptidase regulatory-like domain-containing protein [Catenulispora rubra]